MSAPLDEQLRRALTAHVPPSTPTDEQWRAVVARAATAAHTDRRRRRAGTALLVAAALVVVAVVAVRVGRGPDRAVTTGGPPPAVTDPALTRLTRVSLELAAAAAREAEVTVLTWSATADRARLLAEARAATDARSEAWRAESATAATAGQVMRDAAEAVTQYLGALRTNRISVDGRSHDVSRERLNYKHLTDAAVDVARGAASQAPSVPAARQLTDAAIAARFGTDATDYALAGLVPPPEWKANFDAKFVEQQMAELSVARRHGVEEILADRRLDDLAAAQALDVPYGGTAAGPGSPLATLIDERRDRLMALALRILDETPGANPVTDAGAVHAVVRDLVARRTARDDELWATLMGSPAELYEARAGVDRAVAASRRSLAALAGADTAMLTGAPAAEQAAAAVAGIRQGLDAGTASRTAAAGALAGVGDAEATLLAAAVDATPDVAAWHHGRAVTALVEAGSQLRYAAALALLTLNPAEAARAGGVDRAELVRAYDRFTDAENRFTSQGSSEDQVKLRADADDSMARDLISRAILFGTYEDLVPWADRAREIGQRFGSYVRLEHDLAG
jgi:hypothetical protein